MKDIIKYALILGISTVALTSCEKAIDNSFPEGTPRRAFYNEQIKSYLTNDSVWVTQKLDKNASLVLRVGFDFKKDDKVSLYRIPYTTLTLIEQLEMAKGTFTSAADIRELNSLITAITGLADATARDLILNNPANISFLTRFQKFFPVTMVGPAGKITVTEGSNTFNVIGEFDSSLTFFNSSFLSDLKVSRTFDFDFLINKYNHDSLALTGYYSQNANRNPIIKPIAKASLIPYFDAINIMNIIPFATSIRVNGQVITDESASTLKDNYNETYDNANKSLAFIVKKGKTLNSLYQNNNALAVIEVPFKVGSTKPAVGAVLAKFKAYNLNTKGGINGGLDVEIIVK